jgi:hypothetical protein
MMFSKRSIALGLLLVSSQGVVSCSQTATVDKKGASSSTPALAAGVAPAGTIINTDLQQALSSGKNKKNDKFTLKIKNGSVGKFPALRDATIEGHLQSATKATKGRKAQLDLVFDAIKLKNGDLIPLHADLVNTKIETKTKGQFIKNASIIIGGTIAGSILGDKTKFKQGKLAGAAAATAFVLSSPGGEVELKKGTDIELKLKSPLDPT